MFGRLDVGMFGCLDVWMFGCLEVGMFSLKMKSNRDKILESALMLFNRDGFVNVRLQHIADEAVVSVGNLAYHFPNKDAILLTIYEELARRQKELLAEYKPWLDRIEAKFGVDRHILVAIWSMESSYGEALEKQTGIRSVARSLATLGYADRKRAKFARSQLIAALKIVQAGDIAPSRMTGSWAGAMGHTQFIPTSYLAYAVDFDGDGRRDIWSEDPSDALASTAAYLARSGWVRGQPWGGEVGSRAAGSGTPLAVIQPQAGGPSFAVFKNFQVIKRYNNSDLYALGVGHLSDRLAGAGPLKGRFGPDEFGLTIDDRKRLQARLTAAGYDTGGADGVLGKKTEAAIRAYEQANGLAETGKPSQALLKRLG